MQADGVVRTPGYGCVVKPHMLRWVGDEQRVDLPKESTILDIQMVEGGIRLDVLERQVMEAEIVNLVHVTHVFQVVYGNEPFTMCQAGMRLLATLHKGPVKVPCFLFEVGPSHNWLPVQRAPFVLDRETR